MCLTLLFTVISLCLRNSPVSLFLSDKKRKKEEGKVPVREVKAADGGKAAEEERKKEKPKAHAPSHAKIRSIGTLRLSNYTHTLTSQFITKKFFIYKI